MTNLNTAIERSSEVGSIRALPKGSEGTIDFQPITPEFIIENEAALTTGSVRLCDFTRGCLLMWNNFFNVTAAMVDDMLVCLAGQQDKHDGYSVKGRFYTCPVGSGDFDAAIRAIMTDSEARGLPLKLCTVPEELLERVQSAVGRRARSIDAETARPDFLYPYQNFLGYAGKALHAHRNHVNRFMREVSEHSFEPLTAENRAVALEFLRTHHAELAKGNAFSDEDLLRTEELLGCFDRLGITGGILYANGSAVGFTMGEAVGDTLHVHVEKADHGVHGAYQVLAMSFAKYMQRDELVYINRQDDADDPGLYQSKMSYRPCSLLKKHVLTF